MCVCVYQVPKERHAVKIALVLPINGLSETTSFLSVDKTIICGFFSTRTKKRQSFKQNLTGIKLTNNSYLVSTNNKIRLHSMCVVSLQRYLLRRTKRFSWQNDPNKLNVQHCDKVESVDEGPCKMGIK